MKVIRWFSVSIILVVVFISMSSWGFLVHRTIHQLSVYALPESIQPFFFQNMNYLVKNAPRPDIRRNTDKTEATKHFIDLEMFGKDAVHTMPEDWESAVTKYAKDSLLKYGYLPYHILHMKQKLTAAFRIKNKDSILFYAADIGHYIADANVPLHTTINYDGQLTGQKGLHGVWESMIPELEISHYNLYTNHKASYLTSPQKAIWTAVRSAAALVPSLFAIEAELSKGFPAEQKYRVQIRKGKASKSYRTAFAKAYAIALKSTINDQLISSANLVADFWYTCWVDAGKPDLKALQTNWSDADQQKLLDEQTLYKANQLLESKRLIAKKSDRKTNK